MPNLTDYAYTAVVARGNVYLCFFFLKNKNIDFKLEKI